MLVTVVNFNDNPLKICVMITKWKLKQRTFCGKIFWRNILCSPGCDVKVRSYKFLEAHFKAKHPLLVIPAREANNDTFNQKMEKMANKVINTICDVSYFKVFKNRFP